MSSNDSKNSPSSFLWELAISILAIGVAGWIAVKLIEQIWGWLLIIGGLAVLAVAAVIWLRWWRNSQRW